MRRLLPQLIAAAFVVAAAAPARAQAPAPDAGRICAPVERELEAARRNAESARGEASQAEKRASECATELSGASSKLDECKASTSQCTQQREHLCSATAAFVDELVRGRAKGAAETGCVSPEQQSRLDGVVSGWASTTASLSQLAAYETGETDTAPRARGGATPLERALARVVRNGGGRAIHRRLLVEAMELVAPQAWARMRAAGASTLDAWFSDSAPLSSDIVSEAQHAQAAPPGPAGPPLTAALHLVRAFQVAAKCNLVSSEGGECNRAKQLQQMLESSGSLVVRRRVQEIWATECNSIGADAVSRWIEDFPTAHVAATADPWAEITDAAYAKLFACYLDDASEHRSFGVWLKETLPAATTLTAARLSRVDAIRENWSDASREAACARAVRAMQTFTLPSTCSVPAGEFRPALDEWARASSKLDDAEVPLAMCSQFALLLWEGKAASIDGAFAQPPSLDEMVVAKPMPPTPMWRLRAHCDERRGNIDHFADELAFFASLAKAFGEGVDRAPFRVDPATSRPAELVRYDAAHGTRPWLAHVAQGESACTMIGLSDERCRVCADVAPGAAYDCALVARLDGEWTRRTRGLAFAIAALVLAIALATWARRMRLARRAYGAWGRETVAFFEGIGLACRADRWRWVFPSRQDALLLALPSEPAWERWGSTAAVVRAPPGPRVLERDVNHAAFIARRAGASVVLLEHDDDAGPDLSAVRAMLEWAAKGGSRAVQILPIGVARSRWSKSAHDVLELVEESSLRGNPFELRGRIATSNQFFNRERLVSGLLAAAQAGHWMVVTGLRRFGKSSLALEVARRLPGPSAYVDVAGFDHEIAHGGDPAVAAEAILRFVCLRLAESARDRWPGAELPDAPPADASLDAAALTHWFRELSRASRRASGRTTPLLVVLDELEQALAVGADRLAHSLDVLAIVIGRLKGAVGDAAMPDGGGTMGVFLTSALHPLLWAPLRTLAHQSIMGSFERVCVPCLGDDSATTMMRSLGARQGVRFTDDALARVVAEAQGVPLLLRRLGASILELYDAERARQGSLGAVQIGIEGTTEAIEREAREGSPLRVWIETEIAARGTVPGALLRRLSREETVSTAALCELAKQRIAEDFVRTGISAALPADELSRRAEEAAHVIVQLLAESGLVLPHGDLTAPEAYSLPDGAIRRVLRVQHASVSATPIAPGPG